MNVKGDGDNEGKKNAARSAVSLIEDGMTLGLGTGSTVGYAIEFLDERVREEGLDIEIVPSSNETTRKLIDRNISLKPFHDEVLDLYIDGADQFDAELNLIKGGGAAHAAEKVLAENAKRFICIVDESKETDVLDKPVPLEVLGLAQGYIKQELDRQGGEAFLRRGDGKDGAVITDNGNPVMDCDFGEISRPKELSRYLDGIAGIVEHGLFSEITDELHLGYRNDSEVLTR